VPFYKGSRLAVRDSALTQVVRRQLNRNAVPWHEANEVLSHLTGDVSYNLMTILEFDTELSPWKGLKYGSRKLDYFLIFGHKYNVD
jgi:hypothetical protein